jgi:LysR family transcriptional regulator, benzoate and cis,cis-muconate-responsive activator of ben and cat genes
MDRVTIRELEYFVAVAEELHFGRAAARLHLSQPPLSRQIKALEEKLGVTLLKRDTQTVVLTRPGTLFLSDARVILRQIDRAAEAVRRAEEGQVERFEIGFVPAALESRMVKFLSRFRQAQPQVQVRLHENAAPDLLKALQEKTIDGAFVGTAPAQVQKGFRTVLWQMVPVWIALSKNHPLAKRDGLHLRDLAQEPWIALAQEVAPAFHRQFVRWCMDEGFRPRIIAESSRSTAVLAMVALGDGISLVTDTTAQTGKTLPDLRFQRLRSPFALLIQVFVCRENDDSPILSEFVRIMEEEAEVEPKETDE